MHTHTQPFSLSFSRSLFCSFSYFLFLFVFRRSRTPGSYDEDSLRMERDFSLLVLSLELSRLRIHPSLVIVPSSFCFCCNFKDAPVSLTSLPCVLILCFRPEVITRVQCRGVFVLRERYRNQYFFELLFLCFNLSISRFPVILFHSLYFSLFTLCFLIQVGYLKSRLLINCFSRKDTLHCRDYTKIHFFCVPFETNF